MPNHRLKLGALVSGRGTNLQSIMDHIQQKKLDAELRLVISNKAAAPALERARRRGVKAVFQDPADCATREDYDMALADQLRQAEVDLVCLAGYMRLLTPPFIQAFPGRIINIHPSLLPAFPGLHVQRKALDYGVKISGCTVHFVDEEVDHGPIILQAAVPVLDTDDAQSLAARILEEEHRIYPQAIQLIAEKRLRVENRRVRETSP
ncbi:MAG: phosphoribosylglycinamide formyltransferase [Nitrospinaceae bacterium]